MTAQGSWVTQTQDPDMNNGCGNKSSCIIVLGKLWSSCPYFSPKVKKKQNFAAWIST